MLRWLLFISIILPSMVRAQGVVINEVLADPGQSDADCEWVELFNPGSTEVEIQGWRFGDDPLCDTSLILQPEGFLLLARELIDDDGDGLSFESIWGNGSGVWGDDPLLEGYPALKVSMVLRNEDGSVTIRSPQGVEETFHWDYTQRDRSWEKVNPWGGDGPENWKLCQDLSTPGRRNTWTPPHWDAAVFARGITFFPFPPQPEAEVEIKGWVHNLGDRQILPSSLIIYFFEDSDLDSVLDEGEKIGQRGLEKAIAPGDSVEVSSPGWPFSAGSHLICLLVHCSQDEDLSNNLAGKFLKVPFVRSSVVINEIMYDPGEGPEWVELLNRGEGGTNLRGWMIGDEVGMSAPLSPAEATLQEGGFAIVTSDSSAFSSVYPWVRAPIWGVKGFPNLNNDGDVVKLADAGGQRVDSLSYSHKWGGDRGVSLERINPQLSSGDSTNWSSCVTPRGSTPGEENSIYAPILPPQGDLSINPNPFSPDGDGRDERTIISYRLPVETALITIRVYDLQGRVLATIADQEPTGYEGEKVWDGRDKRGKRLSIGFYILYLEALSSSRGVLVNLKAPLVIAGRL